MKRIIHLFLYSTLLFILSNCYPTQSATLQQSTSKKLPATKYYVDSNQDGIYEEATLDEKPAPNQGQDQWAREFYRSINYPPSARQNGIGGVVVLDVLVDEFGQVKEIGIKQSLSTDCDNAAIDAFRKSTMQGYSAALVDGVALKCRIDIPVGFWLE